MPSPAAVRMSIMAMVWLGLWPASVIATEIQSSQDSPQIAVTDPSFTESSGLNELLSDASLFPPAQPTDPLGNSTLPPSQISVPELPPSLQPNAAVTDPTPTDPSAFGQAIAVRISGADMDLQNLAQSLIQTQVGGSVSETQLQQDVDALLASGFFANAGVMTRDQANGVEVDFVVEPIRVRSLQVTGAAVLDLDRVAQIFQSQINRPISPLALQGAIAELNQWYADNGYALAQVVDVVPNADGVVTLMVVEGIVGNVNLQFLDDDTGTPFDAEGEPVEGRTQESLLREEIQLSSGQVFQQEIVQADLERLANLGLFEDLSVVLQPRENQPGVVDVTYNLVEQLSRQVNAGLGYSTDVGIFGTVTYEDSNVAGIGDQLRASVRVAREEFLQFSTSYTHPYRDSRPDELGWRVQAFRRRILSPTFTDEVDLPDGSTARESRFGGGVAVMRPIGEWDAELGLNYTRIGIRDSDGDLTAVDEQGNSLTFDDSGEDDLVTLAFRATRDRRENPDNPNSGEILRLSTEQSLPIGNGNILMNRLQANYATYLPVDLLGSGVVDNPEVVAFNLQGGTMLGDAPPYEAFNLGGTSSVRGYERSGIGSGRSYILASTEYRFPIVPIIESPILSSLGGVLFADFATDLGTATDLLGDPADVRDKPGDGFGLGFGLRLGTPLGLVRGDLGFNDQGETRLHFGFGQQF